MWPGIWRYLARNSTTLRSGGNSASSRFNWRKVWSGVKCNFTLAHLPRPYVIGKLSIRRARMWNFSRIGSKTKKLWISIVSARKMSEHTRLAPPQKGVKCNFSSPHHHVRKIVGNLSLSRVRIWNFTRIGLKTKKLWLSIILARTLSEQPGLGPRQKGVNCHFSSPEFDKPHVVGKLSISET